MEKGRGLRLTFVRHGSTRLNREKRWQGRLDEPLDAEGLAQAAAVAESFRSLNPRRIYSSPLRRAMQTAEAIAGVAGGEIRRAGWLAEIDHGAAEGLTDEEAEARFPGLAAVWRERPDETVFPKGGESMKDVAARLEKGLRETLARENGGPLVFVTHQAVMSTARCLIESLPLRRAWELKPVNGERAEFFLGEGHMLRSGAAVKK